MLIASYFTRYFIIISLLISTIACTPSINQVKPQTFYSLPFQIDHNIPTSHTKVTNYDFIKIDLPHISSNSMQQNIIYANQPFEKNSYSQSKWKESLASMIQQWLVQSIDQTGLFKGVIRVNSRARVPLILETDVVEFEHHTYDNSVHVSFRIILIENRTRKIVKQKLFNYQVIVTENSAHGAVVAFNSVLKQFNHELYLWLQ